MMRQFRFFEAEIQALDARLGDFSCRERKMRICTEFSNATKVRTDCAGKACAKKLSVNLL
jgi:hypothetical protein